MTDDALRRSHFCEVVESDYPSLPDSLLLGWVPYPEDDEQPPGDQ